MELTNCLSPTVQSDGNESRPIMDPRAWLLKVAIVRIELQRKDPTCFIRSLQRVDRLTFTSPNVGWALAYALRASSRVDLDFEMATLDVFQLHEVLSSDEANDIPREVFARAIRSVREVLLSTGSSVSNRVPFTYFMLKSHLESMAASRPGSKQEYIDLDSELAMACTLHAFLTSVLQVLTSVFQYLIGYVDRGGSKIYSSGAFDFRACFVSLVLFQGAYVWIKFRQAARPECRKRKAPHVEPEAVDIEGCDLKGLHKRSIKNSSGNFLRFKYEPRFTPSRQGGDAGTDPFSKRLPLGEYYTPAEAQIVLQIARYYYDKNGGCVELENGRYKFPIPPMREHDRGLVGLEKWNWVKCRAKEVGKQMYADFLKEKGKHLNIMGTEAGSDGVESNGPSSSTLPPVCSSIPLLPAMVDEPAIGSAAPSSPSPPLFPCDDAIVGDVNVFPESLSGYKDMIAELFYDPGLPNLPDQPSSVISYQMQYQGFAPLVGDSSLLEVGAVPEGVDHDSQPELNSSPSFQQERILADADTENIDARIFLQQSDPVLQQVVFCQKCLGDNARQFVHISELKASQMHNSKLQEENERFRIENESLKSRLQQVASLVAPLS